MVTRGTPQLWAKSKIVLRVCLSLLPILAAGCSQDPAFVDKGYGLSEADAIAAAESTSGKVSADSMDPAAGDESAAGSESSGDGSIAQGDETAEGEGQRGHHGEDSDDGDHDGRDRDRSGRHHGDDDSEESGENARELELITAEYQQTSTNKVDILWVVDVSGSMREEQDNLGRNFRSFIRELASSSLDFQTSVTSTDICPDRQPNDLNEVVCPGERPEDFDTHLRGSFIGRAGRQVLKHDDFDLVDKFGRYTSLGIDGSGFEHGLKAADLAVRKVIAGENENLIRNDAFLAVIVVSDEEDDGIGLGMKDAYNGKNFVELGQTTFRYADTDLSAYLKTVKGEGKFSVSAITGTRDKDGKLCSSENSQPKEEGTQYIKAAKATGGTIESICDTDWDMTLAHLGQDITAQISQITLEKTPVPGSIKVYVDGSLTTKWTYLEGSRVVKFLPGSVPANGATITVKYYAAK